MSYQVDYTEGQKQKLLFDDENKIISVCAYCRVSTDKRDQRNSLKAQTRFFEQLWEKHPNWIDRRIFHDEGISGTSLKKRDDFNEMIQLAKAGKYQLIITKDVSRFSRNVENAMSIIVDLQDRGVYIVFLSNEINTQRQEDRVRLTAAITQAEVESLTLSNRVKFGHLQKMKDGVIFGRREMYGYNIVKDDETLEQKFVVIQDEAAVVKRVFEMYAGGLGTFKIAKQLEREGITTKRYKNGWSNTVILRMLRNERYVGDLCTGKTYTPDPLTHTKQYNRGQSSMVYIRDHHPNEAIISRELWDKVQKLLLENTTSDEIKAKHSNRYWCSGKVICGECAERFVSRQKKLKNGTRHKTWVCWSAQQNGRKKDIVLQTGESKTVGCNSHSVNDRVLRQAMFDVITEYIKPRFADIENDITKIFKERYNAQLTINEREIAKIKNEIEAEKSNLNELTALLARKEISLMAYDGTSKLFEANIQKLTAKLNELTSLSIDNTAAVSTYNRNIEQLRTIVNLEDKDITEAVFRSIISKIEVYNCHVLKLYITFLDNPIIMQYKTVGRNDGYKISFTVLNPDEFEALR